MKSLSKSTFVPRKDPTRLARRAMREAAKVASGAEESASTKDSRPAYNNVPRAAFASGGRR